MRIDLTGKIISDLRKKARDIKKSGKASHALSLNKVAVEAGYEDWRELITVWQRSQSESNQTNEIPSITPSLMPSLSFMAVPGVLNEPKAGFLVIGGKAASGKTSYALKLAALAISERQLVSYINKSIVAGHGFGWEGLQRAMRANGIDQEDLALELKKEDGENFAEDAFQAARSAIANGSRIIIIDDLCDLKSLRVESDKQDKAKQVKMMDWQYALRYLFEELEQLAEKNQAIVLLISSTYEIPGGSKYNFSSAFKRIVEDGKSTALLTNKSSDGLTVAQKYDDYIASQQKIDSD